MDGEGDLGMHHTSSVFADGRLRCLHLSDAPGTSTGFFYMDVTELLGFRPLRHEGKVLGLAAFGDAKPLHDAFKRALRMSPDGKGFESDFANMERAIDKRKTYIAAAIKGHSRENVAAAAQTVFEEAIVGVVRNFMRETGQRHLAVNGGVFANVKLNQRIAALPEVERLFVFPGMSDTGNSVGAAVMVLDKLSRATWRGTPRRCATSTSGRASRTPRSRSSSTGAASSSSASTRTRSSSARPRRSTRASWWAGSRAAWSSARARSATAR